MNSDLQRGVCKQWCYVTMTTSANEQQLIKPMCSYPCILWISSLVLFTSSFNQQIPRCPGSQSHSPKMKLLHNFNEIAKKQTWCKGGSEAFLYTTEAFQFLVSIVAENT